MSRRLAWLMAAVLLSGPVSNVAAAAGPAGHPKAEVVAGRRAATFDGRSSLVATFTAPAAITGNHPFTVAVWAFNPNIGAGQRDPNAGECFVFHVTDNEMVAAHRKSNGWGVTLRKPIAAAREQSGAP